ncbi:MAG: hypothetical protein FWF96_05060 [Kiritimatiellaeota bacterium]|nr:hypothetical protein [Kiritimatiellota bacterium]
MRFFSTRHWAFWLAILAAPAARGVEFDAAAPRAFPGLGVKIPMLARAVGLPERMPMTNILLLRDDGGGDFRLDFFSPVEMWRLHQLAGQWMDASGNLLRLARATFRPPEPDAPWLTHDDFQSLVLCDENRVTSRSPRATLVEWAEAFAQARVVNTRELMINRFALDGAFQLTLDDPAATLYLLRPRFPDGRASEWFALLLKTPAATPAKEVLETLDTIVLPAISTLSRFEMKEAPEGARVDQTRLSSDTPGDHPSRVLARHTVEPYPAWSVTELDNAVLLSDVPKFEEDANNREITRVLPPLRESFASLLPPFFEAPDISVVRITASALMFQRYAGAETGWAAGIYVPARRELVMRQGFSLDETLRVFKHESLHQYLHGAYAGLVTPAWFNEGHAVLFEASRITLGGVVIFEPHPVYADIARKNAETFAERLPGLLTMPYADFYAGDDEARQANYALAWSFIYYLRMGAPGESQAPHAAIIPLFAEGLRETGDPAEATALLFENLDMEKLQDAYKAFISR